MVISLIGYRGCGKSTVAPQLAAALGWDWIDADVELERRAGRSIRRIFETDGEPAFRTLERDVLAHLLQRDRLVVAAGGGSVLREENRNRMRASGPVVWLQADVDVLLPRIQGDATTASRRPSLTGLDPRTEIVQLLAVREPLYRQTATIVVSADERPVLEIVGDVLNALPASLRTSVASPEGAPQ